MPRYATILKQNAHGKSEVILIADMELGREPSVNNPKAYEVLRVNDMIQIGMIRTDKDGEFTWPEGHEHAGKIFRNEPSPTVAQRAVKVGKAA